MHTSLFEYLSKQVERDDPVGDIARDFAVDGCRLEWAVSYADLDGHLTFHRAEREAHEALLEAHREHVTATRPHLTAARARAAETNRRKREERLATELRSRGWTCVPPDEAQVQTVTPALP